MLEIVNDLNVNRVESGEEPEWIQIKSCIDSGAARSVCPVAYCDDQPVVASKSSQQGDQFKTASGVKLDNQGDRVIRGYDDNGRKLALRYAVADVTDALDSVSQICDAGNTVIFNSNGGYIIGPGGKTAFDRVYDTYVRTTWVKNPKKPRRRRNPVKEKDQGDVEMTDAVATVKQVGNGTPFGRPGGSSL